ncbi:MAG: hypothetical protein ABH832_00105 [bacterium]
MTLRQYLIIMAGGTAVCWTVWFLILRNIDPAESKIIAFMLFYSSLFLALTGTISIIGFLIKKRISKNDIVVFHHIKRTFKQAILISSIILVALALLQLELLTLLTGLLIVATFIILESIILTGRKFKNN